MLPSQGRDSCGPSGPVSQGAVGRRELQPLVSSGRGFRNTAAGELDPSAMKLLGSGRLGEGQGRWHLQWERLEGEERQWDGVL